MKGNKKMKKMKTLLSKYRAYVRSLYATANDLLFKKLPSAVGAPLATLLVVAPVLLAIAAYYAGRSEHPSSYTAMITNMSGTGGGSGVIIKNSLRESEILTNAHVCLGALKQGGKIKLVNGEEHIVTGFNLAREHELCVITVAADLKNSIKIASSAPVLYEAATVTGHPALMPNVITNGHFGGRQIISIIVGVRKCKESDFKKREIAPYCIFFGVAPIIRNYEAQIVTATIMRGASGSAILNSDSELSGLVFAGNANGLSYAYIVPFEAIRNFLDRDLLEDRKYNGKNTPWLDEDLENEEEEMSIRSVKSLIEERCATQPQQEKEIREFCRSVLSDIRM